MGVHVLLLGGEDHNLRMPFMRALCAQGCKITIAASGDAGPFHRAGFDFHHFGFNRFFDPVSDLRARYRLQSLLREVDADIAHSFDTKVSLLVPFAAKANPRTAIVRTINGRGWTFSARSPSALVLRAAYLALQRRASRFTDATVFEHSGDQAFFERNGLIGRSESVLIPGAGIDIEGFEQARQSGPRPDDLRREFGLGDALVITTVTRVTKQKGVLTLLKAADLVHRVLPKARFLVVGPVESEGPFAVPKDEFEKRSQYVLATGSRADVPSILGMSDLFAFPSEYAEGVPRALMEAALCALPIVATDLPGCQEVVTDGWNGVIAPQRNPSKLAEIIVDLLRERERARQLAARGPDVIRAKFSLDQVVASHAKLYERFGGPRQLRPASDRRTEHRSEGEDRLARSESRGGRKANAVRLDAQNDWLTEIARNTRC